MALGSFPKLSLDEKAGVKLTTYSVTTGDGAIGNFGGAFYCKLLPPERIAEWMLLFAEKSKK